MQSLPSLEQKINRTYELPSGEKQYFGGEVSGAELSLRESLGGDTSTNEPVVISSRQGEKIVNEDINPVVEDGKSAIQRAREIIARNKEQSNQMSEEDQITADLGPRTTYKDSRGVLFYEDTNQPVPAPANAIKSANNLYYSGGNAYLTPPQDSTLTGTARINQLYDELTIANTEATNALVASLKDAWDRTYKTQERVNNFAKGTYLQAGLRSGQARYSPEINADMIQEVQNEGLDRLKDIDSRYSSAINSAVSALRADNLRGALAAAQEARAAEVEAAEAMSEQLEKANELREAAQKTERAVLRDSAVAELLAGGISDPKEILKTLNTGTKGELVGDFTAEEIKESIENLTVDGDAEKLPTDIQSFNYLKRNNLLPSVILGLPEDQQYLAYINMSKQASAGKLTQQLLESGLPSGVSGGGRQVFVGAGASSVVEEEIIRTRLFSKLMNILNKGQVSDSDREIIDGKIATFRNAGMTEQQIMDSLAGFATDVQTPYNEKFRNLLVSNTPTAGDQTEQIGKVSLLLNAEAYEEAMKTVENVAYKRAKDIQGTGDGGQYMSSNVAQTYMQNIQDVRDAFDEAGIDFTSGTFQSLLGRVKGPKAAELKAKLTNLYAAFRKENLGSAVTPSEAAFLEPLLSGIAEKNANFKAKLDAFERGLLNRHNATRRAVSLPEVNAKQILDDDERLRLYESPVESNPFSSALGETPTIVGDDGSFNIPTQ